MWKTTHFFFLTFFCFAVNAAPGDRLIVRTSNGNLSGVEAITNQGTTFWGYLGIPYAAPPIGDLRFKAPRPAASWPGIRDASYERSHCVQNGLTHPLSGSEDCLFVNVLTINKPGSNMQLLPVMVWIHGGGFVFGSGNIGLHGADGLLDNGVIVVALNYRLGVFGFLCTEDSTSPGNYGLKDQIAALRWVSKNIINFGGDPKNVTIFGESAGAASVNYLLQSKLTKGLYQKAIAESGSTLNTWAVGRNARDLAFRIGIMNGIFALDSTYLVNHLRTINYRKLQYSTLGGAVGIWDYWNGLPFSPCKEHNVPGAVVTSDSFELLKYGDFVKVPFLAGYNSNEARDSAQLNWLITLYSTQFEAFPDTLVPKDMNAAETKTPASKIKSYYFHNKPIHNDSNFIHYASDSLFLRGIRKTIQLRSRYVPTYFYRFSFTGGIQHNSFQPEGVSHGEELQFLFNTSLQKNAAAILTARRMTKLWTNFAKTGNPTPTFDPMLGATWPLASSAGYVNVSYLDIGTNLVPALDPQPQDMNFWEWLYTQYGFQPYDSY